MIKIKQLLGFELFGCIAKIELKKIINVTFCFHSIFKNFKYCDTRIHSIILFYFYFPY